MYQFKHFFNALGLEETPTAEYRANRWAQDNQGKVKVVAISYHIAHNNMEHLYVCYQDLEMEDNLLSDEDWRDEQRTIQDYLDAGKPF